MQSAIRLMTRKLKTYQTALGFFEQAIAAPSMKAALEAWGADSNLFHQGAAKESHEPDVIAATMAKPGVVLKRPVGSDGAFGENAELPKNLDQDGPKKSGPKPAGRKAKETSAQPDKVADRKASQAYDRERQRRERKEAREEAARQKERERRQQAVDRAQAVQDEAEQRHARRVTALRAEIEAIEEKLKAENAAWDKEERRLNAALRRARGDG
jgi:hypothetical protein